MKLLFGFLSTRRRICLPALLLLVPSLAQAHPGHGPATGFGAGLAHPLTGADHIAAMVAIGLWAAQRGGRALWAMPLMFVAVMSFSAGLGLGGTPMPFVDQGIAASVLILGILVAAAWRLPMVASFTLVGLFAVFHGYAHGTEMPATVSGLAYGAGFIAATVSLHLLGVITGLAAKKLAAEKMVRLTGGVIALGGFCLLITT